MRDGSAYRYNLVALRDRIRRHMTRTTTALFILSLTLTTGCFDAGTMDDMGTGTDSGDGDGDAWGWRRGKGVVEGP